MRDYVGLVSITAGQEPPPPSRKKSKREIARIIDEIGRMLAAGMIDREIWQRLGLTRTRYFVYRARLYQQSGDLFDKTTNDELIYHKDLLHERLTRLFRQAELDLTQTTGNNSNNNLPLNTRDRAATYLAAQNIAINIFKLEHEGLRVLSHDGVNSNRYLRRVIQKPNQEGKSAFFQDTLRKEAELQRLYARKESQATRTRSLTNPRFINLLEQIQGLPFWIEDREEHKAIIQECKDLELERLVCCFNHCLGLPTKNGNPMPIFDYESRIIDALQGTDRIWIKKARGLGVTELIIRYIVWLCLRNNDLKDSICFIVTGPRQNIAMEHVQRIERLFEPFGIYSETRMGITELNDVFIQTIPSKNIGAMRGYD